MDATADRERESPSSGFSPFARDDDAGAPAPDPPSQHPAPQSGAPRPGSANGSSGTPSPPRRSPSETLESIERSRRQLWFAAGVVLLALSAAIAIVSLWSDQFPEPVADALNVGPLRWVFVLLSLAFMGLVWERERSFGAITRALVEQRGKNEALETRLREVTALADLARRLRTIMDEPAMGRVSLSAATAMLEAPKGVFAVLDEESGMLQPVEYRGFADGSPPRPVALREGAIGDAAARRIATLIGPDDAVPWLRDEILPWSIAAPLVDGDQLLGVLWVGGEGRRFGDYQVRLLSLVAEQTAGGIANVRAYAHERASVSRLAEMDRMKTDFVATVTHELKTPLTSLLGYATILRRRGDAIPPEQREEFFAIMSRQGERILRLIEELLQSSRMEAGGNKLRRERLDLREIVERVATDLRSVSKAHRIVVDAGTADAALYGDPVAIEHVLGNLVDNAIKYSPQGGTVTISVRPQESEMRVSVADEGRGIEPADIPHIFDRFKQSGAPHGRSSVGLGLYIVRGLVEAHGGRVWVDSIAGRGSTFTFSLPRRRSRGNGAPAEPDPAPPLDFPA